MATKDPRVDAYIAEAREFARPILRHLRSVVHAGCPAATETIKWGFPHFLHGGILCSMAAFNEHCAFGFWKHSRVVPKAWAKRGEAMGVLGRIRSVADLPPKATLLSCVREAAVLAASKPAPARRRASPRSPAETPDDLAAALAKDAAARASYARLSPSHRREYVEWIGEAKREETRARRLAKTVEWLAQGKTRNWKYAKR